MKIRLSHTGLELMNRCPRCFWLQYKKGIRQPEGIQSRLANRFDGIIKRYFDIFRGIGELPPMLEGKVKGKLEQPFQERYTAPIDEQYEFYGKLDECLVDRKRHTPVDHKTTSSDPNEKGIFPAYQAQLDSYAHLLEANGKPITGIGHLVYYYPIHTNELHEGCKMQFLVQTLKTNPEHTRERIARALTVLRGKMPTPSADCPFCTWQQQVAQATC